MPDPKAKLLETASSLGAEAAGVLKNVKSEQPNPKNIKRLHVSTLKQIKSIYANSSVGISQSIQKNMEKQAGDTSLGVTGVNRGQLAHL